MGSPMFFGAAHASSLGFELILLVVERTGRNGDRQIGAQSSGSSKQPLDCTTLVGRKRRVPG